MKKTYKKEELDKIAKELLESLKPSKNATILLLEGDLGAGKTTFTQSLAKALGHEKELVSPTFVIQKRYPVSFGFFQNLIHIDAYRLNGSADIERLGWSEWIKKPENIIVVEWPDIISESLPSFAKRVKFSHVDEETREIEYE